jgi:hypothetical protein
LVEFVPQNDVGCLNFVENMAYVLFVSWILPARVNLCEGNSFDSNFQKCLKIVQIKGKVSILNLLIPVSNGRIKLNDRRNLVIDPFHAAKNDPFSVSCGLVGLVGLVLCLGVLRIPWRRWKLNRRFSDGCNNCIPVQSLCQLEFCRLKRPFDKLGIKWIHLVSLRTLCFPLLSTTLSTIVALERAAGRLVLVA